MFIVTLIFMAQFVFVVQQALLHYSLVDLPTQLQQRDADLLVAALRTVNQTVASAADCGSAQQAFEQLRGFYAWDRPLAGGFTVALSGTWDCSAWGGAAPPLMATIVVTGPLRESRVTAGFYHD